jgi:hypothetical protein
VFTSHPVRCHGHERDPSGGRARPRIGQPWIPTRDGSPAVRARPKLPAANHRSAGPRSAHPPGLDRWLLRSSYYSARRTVTPFSSVHVLHCLDKLCCSWLGCASERRKQAAVVWLLFVPGSTSRAGMQHLLCTRRHLPFMNSFSLPDFQSPKQESRLQ